MKRKSLQAQYRQPRRLPLPGLFGAGTASAVLQIGLILHVVSARVLNRSMVFKQYRSEGESLSGALVNASNPEAKVPIETRFVSTAFMISGLFCRNLKDFWDPYGNSF